MSSERTYMYYIYIDFPRSQKLPIAQQKERRRAALLETSLHKVEDKITSKS